MSSQEITRIDNSTISATDLTESIEQMVKKGKVHGMALVIVSGEEILYQKTFGTRDIRTGEALSFSDGFYAASFSKALFAYIVMKLVDEGTLDLDEPLQTYLDRPLPEYEFEKAYEGYDDLKNDPRYKQITARMCLSHSSGFPNWRYIGRLSLNLEKPLEIENDPGTYYSYSGEGIYLLHFVVEQLTGRKLEDMAQEYVFKPFGMDMSSFVWQERFEGKRATGHFKKDKTVPIQRRLTANAAGSMETTPADFTKFLQAMLRKEGLRPESHAEIISPQIAITSERQFGPKRFDNTDENKDIQLSYGLGWGIYQTPHGKAVFKEGHLRGWEHYCIFYPEKDLGVVIMTNSSNGEDIFRDLLRVTSSDSWMPWKWEGYKPYK